MNYLTVVVLTISMGFVVEGSFFGGCPKIKSDIKLSGDTVNKFLGTWYEHSRSGPVMAAKLLRCSYIEANKPISSADHFFRYIQYFKTPLLDLQWSISGYGKIIDAQESKLGMSLDLPLFGKLPLHFQIVHLDENTALLVYCTDFVIFHYQTVVILTRGRNPSDASLQLVKQALKNAGLQDTPLNIVYQDDCKY